MTRASVAAWLAVAVGLMTGVVGIWSWHARVFHARHVGIADDPWEQVRTSYPLAEAPGDLPPLSTETAEAVIQANPFSPERRRSATPSSDGGTVDGAGTEPGQPPKPQFVYKGRINVGKRQRAIVEDTAIKKTYFLEVGQEVAGFKVLDITETRVLLSDPQTNEPIALSLSSAGPPATHQAGSASGPSSPQTPDGGNP